MKPILVLLAVLLLLPVAGCMSRYDIVTSNNVRVLSKGKPVLDKQAGVYRYTDAAGKKATIAAIRVRQIAPHSNKQDNNSSGY
jgi:hypothetical protein